MGRVTYHKRNNRNHYITCLNLDCPEWKGGRCLADRSGKLTSEKWHELTKNTEAIVVKPLGWGTRYRTGWYYEKISYQEYSDRRSKSECSYNPEFIDKELELARMTNTRPALSDDIVAEHIDKFETKVCYSCGVEYKLFHEECLHEDISA